MDRREQHISDNIEAARRRDEEARELLAEYERKLASAADQVRGMLEEARHDAERTKQEIVAEAKAAAQGKQERAMRDIRQAADAAVQQLSEKSADLAVQLAGKIITAKLTPDERSRVSERFALRFAAAPVKISVRTIKPRPVVAWIHRNARTPHHTRLFTKLPTYDTGDWRTAVVYAEALVAAAKKPASSTPWCRSSIRSSTTCWKKCPSWKRFSLPALSTRKSRKPC